MAEPQLPERDPIAGDSKPAESTDAVYDFVRWAKGTFIDGGVSGIVELSPNGDIIKSPWLGQDAEQCREDMAQEARAYRRLFDHFGAHRRFVKLISYDEAERAITMEYMVNGTLREYLQTHNNRISRNQRLRWIYALTEGMVMLHSASIVHCDYSPRNMLLDKTLELKVADFGCVSMDGSKSSAGGSARFYLPRGPNRERIEVHDDIFALGSSIFEVWTGKSPYADLETDAIRNLYGLQQFPDLVGVDMKDIIRDCWLFRARSAKEIYQKVLAHTILQS